MIIVHMLHSEFVCILMSVSPVWELVFMTQKEVFIFVTFESMVAPGLTV